MSRTERSASGPGSRIVPDTASATAPPMAAFLSASVTTTNAHCWLLPGLEARVAAQTSLSSSSGATGSALR